MAIRDDDLPGLERRRDDLGDELAPARHEEVHLRLRIDLKPRVKDDLPDALTQLRATRLPDDYGVARRQPLADHLDLRRFAGALRALERYEEPGHPQAGASGENVMRRRRCGSLPMLRAESSFSDTSWC